MDGPRKWVKNLNFLCSKREPPGEFYLVGIPFDYTSTYRPGARFAPYEIRKASHSIESFSFYSKKDLCEVDLVDLGDLEVPSSPELLEEFIALDEIADSKFAVLGGDHSVTLPILRKIRDRIESYVQLDAHLDMREEYLGEKFGHASVARRAVEILGEDRVLLMGVRSASKEEYRFCLERGIEYYPPEDWDNGIESISSLRGEVYLSIDLDVLDSSYAPGVGNPEPMGVSPSQVIEVIRTLGKKIKAFDVVELNPLFDSGITSVLAAHLVRETILLSL